MKVVCIENIWGFRKGKVYDYKMDYYVGNKVLCISYDPIESNKGSWGWSVYEYFLYENIDSKFLYYYSKYFITERKFKLKRLEYESNL